MTGPPYLSDQEVVLIAVWIDDGLLPSAAPAVASDAAVPAQVVVAPVRSNSNDPPSYLDVAPIFATRCAKCHTESGLMGAAPEGFRLTSHADTLASGERARVVPGQPQASELLRRIRGQALPRMPFDGPPYLSDAEIALIERWIAAGARDAEGQPAPLPVGAAVRLHGTLDGAASLDGWEFERTASTRLDKRPQPGDYVQLRGHIGADGRVIAERLRRR
jgi:mono/diheme cytochrome c family protein